MSLFGWLACIQSKSPPVKFIPATYPNFVEMDANHKQLWLDRFFGNATTEETRQSWNILLDPAQQHIRSNAIQSVLKNTSSKSIAMAFVGNPDIPAYERCYVAIHAHHNHIELSKELLPKELQTSTDRAYCSLFFAYAEPNPDIYQTLAFADLPLFLDFYKTLPLLKRDALLLRPIIEQKLQGSEEDFFYTTLFSAWFLLDPAYVEPKLISYLQASREEDRMEAFELLWGHPESASVFATLSNTDSHSGIFAHLAYTALGQDNIDFNLEYMYGGLSWDLRLVAILSAGMWHRHNSEHPQKGKVEKELIALLKSERKDVLIHVLQGLQSSNIFNAIPSLDALLVDDPELIIERAAALRTLSRKGQKK